MPEVTTRYKPGTPCWVDLMAKDQQAALDFYRDLFGWQGEVGPPEYGGYAVCTLNGKAVAAIGTAMAPEGQPTPPTVWTTHLASADDDATLSAINANGGTTMVSVMDVGTLGRMLIAADPTGAVFGSWQAVDFIGAQVVNEPGSVTWNELHTNDPDTARAFYSKVYGVQTPLMEGAKHYWTLNVEGRPVGGITPLGTHLPAGTPSHWLTHFAVDDTDSTVDAVVKAGGSVLSPPEDTPYGRAALVQDPQGATFGLIKAPQ